MLMCFLVLNALGPLQCRYCIVVVLDHCLSIVVYRYLSRRWCRFGKLLWLSQKLNRETFTRDQNQRNSILHMLVDWRYRQHNRSARFLAFLTTSSSLSEWLVSRRTNCTVCTRYNVGRRKKQRKAMMRIMNTTLLSNNSTIPYQILHQSCIRKQELPRIPQKHS